MTCKDCVHYEVCAEQDAMLGENTIDEIVGVENHCELFKPKSRFVELPCEVGQTVYVLEPEKYWDDGEWVDVLSTEKVSSVCVYGEYDTIIFAEDFGKTVFLSREEAEKALAERSK